MRERRKEPREGSEIDPETACIQTVGAPASRAFTPSGFFRARLSRAKEQPDEIDPDGIDVHPGFFGARARLRARRAKEQFDEIDPDR